MPLTRKNKPPATRGIESQATRSFLSEQRRYRNRRAHASGCSVGSIGTRGWPLEQPGTWVANESELGGSPSTARQGSLPPAAPPRTSYRCSSFSKSPFSTTVQKKSANRWQTGQQKLGRSRRAGPCRGIISVEGCPAEQCNRVHLQPVGSVIQWPSLRRHAGRRKRFWRGSFRQHARPSLRRLPECCLFLITTPGRQRTQGRSVIFQGSMRIVYNWKIIRYRHSSGISLRGSLLSSSLELACARAAASVFRP